ncbi:hypothetical protein CEXT_557561 [Caerostris extrusa]|uniref:Uncharacterized protein n=1 Tax=Caerostris extrusa TaxID=172846 RepID=A0AAV4PBK3_CAEEX|nr:hypothetical protein CEXT_557561 [Caerostris extrusa]
MNALKSSLMDPFCEHSRIFYRKSSWKPSRMKSEECSQEPGYEEVGKSLALLLYFSFPALKASLMDPFCELTRIFFRKSS